MSSASNSFAAQFGEKLRCPLKSTEVSPTTALDGKDYVSERFKLKLLLLIYLLANHTVLSFSNFMK